MSRSDSRVAHLALLFFLYLMAPHGIAADAYRVDSEDVLNVKVFDEPELSIEEARVSASGTIAMPLLGEVKVAGMTTTQIGDRIRTLLLDGYLKNPRVSVSVYEYRQVFVHGAVQKPGGYSYQEGLTVQKAIVLAGGLTERASTSKITVIHENEPNIAVRADMNQRVLPGDIISVGESFF